MSIIFFIQKVIRYFKRSFLFKNVDPAFHGFLDYYLNSELGTPSSDTPWGGPFNGQRGRQQIFKDIIKAIPFTVAIETGTYRGITSEYIQTNSNIPLYTIENQRNYYGYCKAKFFLNKKIKSNFGDSRFFLSKLIKDLNLKKKTAFVYLDAHWYDNLPLRDELRILLENKVNAVIMIDDFQVPDDSGYSFDDYGQGNALTLEYLQPLYHFDFALFFPKCHSSVESGAKRGCIVLSTASQFTEILKDIPSLVYFTH